MAGDEQLVRIGGRRLRITNLEKVLYPETGTTKGEVIDYYSRIAEALIPHVVGRPVTRKRWPDGVGTQDDPSMVFFAKDLERGAPSWVRRMPIPHSTGQRDQPREVGEQRAARLTRPRDFRAEHLAPRRPLVAPHARDLAHQPVGDLAQW